MTLKQRYAYLGRLHTDLAIQMARCYAALDEIGAELIDEASAHILADWCKGDGGDTLQSFLDAGLTEQDYRASIVGFAIDCLRAGIYPLIDKAKESYP